MIVAKTLNDHVVLVCDECPEKPDYSDHPDTMATDWEKSCIHIEQMILTGADTGDLLGGHKYQIPMSQLASYLCRDMWAGWVTIKLDDQEPSGICRVHLVYDSELFTQTRAEIGFVMPEDGRQTIRSMVWDYVSAKILEAQPTVETDGLKCPQRTHKGVAFSADVNDSQTRLNPHLLTIAFENCCCYCYRSVMGNDANADSSWGLDTPKAPAQRQRAPRPGASSPRPGSTQQPSVPASRQSSPPQASPASRSTKGPGAPPPPVHRVPTSTANDASKTMSELLDDPELPF